MVQAAKEPFWGAQGLQAHSLGCSCGTGLCHTCVQGVNKTATKGPPAGTASLGLHMQHMELYSTEYIPEKTDQKLLEGMEEDFQRGKAMDTKANLLTMVLPRAVQ